jgi:hypothetical protein
MSKFKETREAVAPEGAIELSETLFATGVFCGWSGDEFEAAWEAEPLLVEWDKRVLGLKGRNPHALNSPHPYPLPEGGGITDVLGDNS